MPDRETVTCFDHQPESWYRTANTLGFDRGFTAASDPSGVLTNGVFAEPAPPYGGRYAHPRPTRGGSARVARYRLWSDHYASLRRGPL